MVSYSAYAQHTVIVNPDGTHSVVINNGTTSTIVNSNGTLSIAINNGNTSTIVNPYGTHSVVIKNGESATKDKPKWKKLRVPKSKDKKE